MGDGREPEAGTGQTGSPEGAARPDRVPWLIALAVFAAYVPISIFRYLRLDPTSWDLGIFTEYVKQYAHLHAPIVDIRGAGFNLLGDHFHPIVALIAPFFRIFPTPITLLVAQALLAAVSVVPVSRAAADRLGTGAGRAIGAAYGFSWGLQQMVNYDFHEIAFAVPLLACSLSALVRGRMRAAVWWALPLVFVKEDQGFTLAAIGLLMVIVYKRPRAGMFLAIWGLAWSFLAIIVIIPHFSPTHHYLYWSDGGTVSPVGGHFSVAGVVSQLATGWPTKMPTLALILLPTAFLALSVAARARRRAQPALRFVGTNSAYWGTAWHYNATVMPIVFIAAIDGMARIRAASEGRAAGGRSWPRPSWPASGAAADAGHRRRTGLPVPAEPAVDPADLQPSARTWPRPGRPWRGCRTGRRSPPTSTCWRRWRPGPTRSGSGNFPTNPATQYVVFDTASTDWQPPPSNVLGFVESLNHGVRYRQIYVNDGVYVFIRSGAPAWPQRAATRRPGRWKESVGASPADDRAAPGGRGPRAAAPGTAWRSR